MIVVDNVPRVEPDKLEKLQSVINKVLGKFGTIVNQYYPMNENDGKTKGLVVSELKKNHKAISLTRYLAKCLLASEIFSFSLVDTFF